MILTNLEHCTAISNCAITFDLDGTSYVLLTDGYEKVLNGAMDEVDEELTDQLLVAQNYDTETTAYYFDDFSIEDCNGELSFNILQPDPRPTKEMAEGAAHYIELHRKCFKTYEQAAEFFDVSVRTINRWIQGDSPIKENIFTLLNYKIKHGELK